MDRRDLARIGFVLLGSWLLVRALTTLPSGSLDLQLGRSLALSAALGLVLGAALLVGARPSARLWARWQSPQLDAAAPRDSQARA